MAIILDHSPLTLPAGSREAQAALPGTDRIIILRFARRMTATPTLWAPGVTFALAVDISSDGGSTWWTSAGMTAEGGIVQAKNGGELAESRLTCGIPASANRVRVALDITGGTLVTELTVETQG